VPASAGKAPISAPELRASPSAGAIVGGWNAMELVKLAFGKPVNTQERKLLEE
jgi:hypothetical protein